MEAPIRTCLAAVLAIFALVPAPPGQAEDRAAGGAEDFVGACLQAWQQEAAHGDDLTLLEHSVKTGKVYTIVKLTLGSGEGRLIYGKCRIKKGKVTHIYE